MRTSYKKISIFSAFLFAFLSSSAQNGTKDSNPISTAMPSLTIAPEARGSAMGDIGAATTPDVFSQHWNPAKYAFSTSNGGVGISYTPWLSKIVDDIALIYVSGYFKFGNDGNQAVSASLRYFKIGEVPERNEWGVLSGTVNPYEMAFDIGYSRKLSETFSGAVALRYIRADYPTSSDDNSSTPGNAFAADIAGYNESYVMIGEVESLLGLGFNISNIGTKMSMDDGEKNYFLPTNMRLGASLTYPLDDYNTIAFNADINKLLVPTPPTKDHSGDNYDKDWEDYQNTSSISGIFKSFGDAPGGFSEELKEVSWSIGAEYTYNNQFAIRGGYFNEDKMKGNRKYFSFGAGLKLSSFMLDASYLVSTESSNPLDQTLRFSIGFDLDGLKSLLNR